MGLRAVHIVGRGRDGGAQLGSGLVIAFGAEAGFAQVEQRCVGRVGGSSGLGAELLGYAAGARVVAGFVQATHLAQGRVGNFAAVGAGPAQALVVFGGLGVVLVLKLQVGEPAHGAVHKLAFALGHHGLQAGQRLLLVAGFQVRIRQEESGIRTQGRSRVLLQVRLQT